MVKQSRKKLRIKKRNSNRRITTKMFGGSFTDEDKKELINLGFSPQDIEILSTVPVGLNIIKMSLQQNNPQSGKKFTPSEIIDSINTTQGEINNTRPSFNSSGGKKRKTRRGKTRRCRTYRSRKQRGGMCFGNGVGENNYEPNFSIYNTRELSLFPYRPTN